MESKKARKEEKGRERGEDEEVGRRGERHLHRERKRDSELGRQSRRDHLGRKNGGVGGVRLGEIRGRECSKAGERHGDWGRSLLLLLSWTQKTQLWDHQRERKPASFRLCTCGSSSPCHLDCPPNTQLFTWRPPSHHRLRKAIPDHPVWHSPTPPGRGFGSAWPSLAWREKQVALFSTPSTLRAGLALGGQHTPK